MQKLKLFLLFLTITQLVLAQYTEVINSKRPGFSDSPYSVGTDVYQVEGGLFYKNIGNYLFWNQEDDEPNRYSSKSYGTDIFIRASKFIERLEVDIDLSFVRENREYIQPPIDNIKKIGLGRFTVGAKYLVYMPTYEDKSKEIRSWKKRNAFDKKRLIPAVGVYAGVNTNLVNELYKNPDGVSPRFAIYTQNNLSDKFIVLTNWIADYLFTDNTEYSIILTSTYSLTDQISVFGEGQAFRRKNVPNDYQFGIGGAYLFTKSMQFDTSVRFINDERGDHTFLIGAGMSWRLDRHKDKFKTVDSNGEEAKSEKEGNVFTRLLGKNKTSKQRKVKQVKAKKRKVKTIKTKKSAKQKREEKEAKKRAKDEKKQRKKELRDYNKNYEPPSNDDT